MKGHFESLVESLSQEDLLFLNELYSNDATSNYKSLSKEAITTRTSITESAFRKTVTRLVAMDFIFVCRTQRNPMYSLTNWGLIAIDKITEEVCE
jgi:RIO-like serine/threonine protein kinase